MRDTAGCLRPFWVVTIHKTAINRFIEVKDLKSFKKTKTKTKKQLRLTMLGSRFTTKK